MAVNALIGIGLALSAVGTVVQMQGQAAQTRAMQKAEATRQQQLALDTHRRTIETTRKSIVAMATAEAAANAQGAQGGSGLPGGLAQISGEQGRTEAGNQQNKQLGDSIFASNQAYYSASGTTGFGVGLGSLGGMLMQNAGAISRVGGGFFGSNATA